VLFFLPSLLTDRDFWVEDEARYAEVIREMLINKQWLVPHLNNHLYPDKPPLYFWLTAFIYFFTGTINPFTFLIISLIGCLGCVITTYFIGKLLFDTMSGFISALILEGSLLFLISTYIVRMDTLFTFFIILSFYFFILGFQRHNRGLYTWSYVFSALAVLCKGPLGLVLVFIPAVLFLAFKSELKELRAFLINPGLIIFVCLVFGWLFLVIINGYGEFVENIINKQIAARIIDSFKHKEPFYYYFLLLPLIMIPWMPFIPRALKKCFQKKSNDGFLFLFLWIFAGIVILSCISCKLFIYLLPLTPPLAICIGALLSPLWSNDYRFKKMFLWEGSFALFLLLALFVFLLLISRIFPTVEIRGLFFISLFSFVLGLSGVLLLIYKRHKAFLLFLFVGMFVFSTLSSAFFVPKINTLYSPREIGQKIKFFSERGYQIGTFKITRGIFNFYAGCILSELKSEELGSFFNISRKRLLVIKKHDFRKQSLFLKNKYKILQDFFLNNEKYYFVTKEGDQ
jgi:4-amino-4-deoxy-L-arabinose transferase-like glycosyltransferase